MSNTSSSTQQSVSISHPGPSGLIQSSITQSRTDILQLSPSEHGQPPNASDAIGNYIPQNTFGCKVTFFYVVSLPNFLSVTILIQKLSFLLHSTANQSTQPSVLQLDPSGIIQPLLAQAQADISQPSGSGLGQRPNPSVGIGK